MIENITKKTLQEIERKFGYYGRYIKSRDQDIFCPHVNGLVNICLSELGFQEHAKNNSQAFLVSQPSFGNLFYNEVDKEGRILDDYVNSCRNAVLALALISTGYFDKANRIIDNLKESPLYDSETGLFQRQYNPASGEINPLIITQTNLWIILALAKLKREKEAHKLLKILEKEKYDESEGLFFSQDCRFQDSEKRFFCDDQALGCLVYLGLDEHIKARELMRNMIKGQLYDGTLFHSSFSKDSLDKTKSSYKNGLCGIALGKLRFINIHDRLRKGLVEQLYDPREGLFNQSTNDRIKIPDNSALALMALEYDNLKHLIF